MDAARPTEGSPSLPLVALAGAFALPAVADAKRSTFHRYEVIGDARYVAAGEQCPEGSDRSTAQTNVSVTAGHEDESENRTTTLDNDYLRFGIQRFECDGSVFTDSAFSQRGDDVTFTYGTSLSRAAVTGTLTTAERSTVTVDMSWRGLGRRAEVTNRKTKFPGFSGTFQGKTRDAVATGTVVYGGPRSSTGRRRTPSSSRSRTPTSSSNASAPRRPRRGGDGLAGGVAEVWPRHDRSSGAYAVA